MSPDAFETDVGNNKRPTPIKTDVEIGTWAVGIWSKGQTIYRREQDPFKNENWEEKYHFEHTDSEVRGFRMDNVIEQPQVSSSGELQAIWLYSADLDPINPAEKDNSTNEQSESSDDKNSRSVGEIQQETAHHRVLQLISKKCPTKQEAMPTSELMSHSSESEGTIYATMTTLYKRRLVDRYEEERDNNQNRRRYWITEWGKQHLSELGEPKYT